MICLTVQPRTLAGVLEEEEVLCPKAVMELGQHNVLHTEELDNGLLVELDIRTEIFW